MERKKNRASPIYDGHQATSSWLMPRACSSTHSQETPMTVYANEQNWASLSNDKTSSTKSSNRASALLEAEMSRSGLDSIADYIAARILSDVEMKINSWKERITQMEDTAESRDLLYRWVHWEPQALYEAILNADGSLTDATGQRSCDILKNVVPQLKETSVNDRSGDTQSVSVTPKIEQANSWGDRDSDYTGYELPQSRESDKRSSNNPDGNCEWAESRDLLHRWVHWEPHAGYEAILNTDGSLTDATGKWGAVIRTRDGMVLAAAHGTSRFNNIAFIEMEALFKGLSLALGKGLTSLEACTDSMAVIHILESNDPPWKISRTRKKIQIMYQHFTKLSIHHIYREANQLADRIAACSPALKYVEIIPSSFSEDLKKIVFEDSIGIKHLRVYELPQSRTSEKRESDKPGIPKFKLSLLVRNREKRIDRERTFSVRWNPIHLRPGMVLLKNFISPADQIKVIKILVAEPPTIPNEFRKLVSDAIQASRQGDRVRKPSEDIPLMEPDICIVDFYTSTEELGLCHITGKLGLHQDRDESPESLKRELPVVSFSIGDSAEFLYGDERDEDKAEKVERKSGDVLIFGGKSRLICHGVSCIIPNSAPKFLADEPDLGPGHLNLTFRKY